MTKQAKRNDDIERERTDTRSPPPRTSGFRYAAKVDFANDPRASYSRALVNLGRVGDVAHALTAIELFEAFCDAVAEPLGLSAAVAIDSPAGLPRALSWKADSVDWKLVEDAERRAWASYAELVAPELAASLSTDEPRSSSGSGQFSTMQPLGVPLLGIIECVTARRLTGSDHGLLKYMSVRLSTALARAIR